VVTFTTASTQELRDRLRKRLVKERDDIVSKQGESRDFHRINLAIQSFDQASIYTIHGFCQRILSDFAFESALRFDVTLLTDEAPLLLSVTDDFWRQRIPQQHPRFVRFLVEKKQTPDTLLGSIRSLIGKSYLNFLPLSTIDYDATVLELDKAFESVKECWAREHEQVVTTLTNKTLLKGYRSDHVQNWLEMLNQLIGLRHVPMSLFKQLVYFTKAKLEVKPNQTLPELEFWTACENLITTHQRLGEADVITLQQLRMDLLRYLEQQLPELKIQQQVQSFDDLLVSLEKALGGEHGAHLVQRIQGQYQAALIDEFQDTDPVQYGIFKQIYANSGLTTFYVGDPKQAIYSFRGADIFTYLEAKSESSSQHTLPTNYRSHPRLIQAVNAVFSNRSDAFIYEDIPFVSVGSGREDEPVLQIDGDHDVPLQFWWFDSDKPATKGDMNAWVSEHTADDIARLLNLAQHNKAHIKKNDELVRLTGGDIAILVRSHRQASLIQQCLQKRGISCVQQGRENVFQSFEAIMMERLILAVSTPSHSSHISAVLASPLFGFSARQIFDAQQNEQMWSEYTNLFQELHQQWLKHGFISMFRYLCATQSVQKRVLMAQDGERQLTNLYHLSELIQEFCSRQKKAIDSVATWLSNQRAASEENETAQLRLESDEQLVKIITIHKSKGLEYPIVYCPFLWADSLRSSKDDIIRFHDAENEQAAYVAFDPVDVEAAKAIAEQEERAEDLRLLYVALTRARERCIIPWGHISGIGDTALYSLLHPTLAVKASGEEIKASLDEFVAKCNENAVITRYEAQTHIVFQSNEESEATLAARMFDAQIQKPWRIGSFSSLTSGHDPELPDHDNSQSITLDEQGSASSEPFQTLERFNFPKGAQAGVCLHSIFELWNFDRTDTEQFPLLVSKQLQYHGFDDTRQQNVCEWFNEIVGTPLTANRGFSLADIKPDKRIDEMEFYFSVANLHMQDLKSIVQAHCSPDSALYKVMKSLSFNALTGFMKGFIDMVFEYEGQYYIVDYKSNYLGNNPSEYRDADLERAMLMHDYPLQYLIYSLALHRYLSIRLADYDPNKHLGGVFYLFIRGMKPEWEQTGIFHDTVNPKLLCAMDDYFKGIGLGDPA
jgi:exodeoxyribonuclease V beta subunit